MNFSLSSDDRNAVKTLVERPELLRGLKFDLMLELAQNNLSGQNLAEALRLRDTDPECAAFLAATRALFEAPSLRTASTARSASVTPFRLLDALAERLREMYQQLNTPGLALAAPGDGAVDETPVVLGNVTATLRRLRRADGHFDIELVIPASAGLTPAELAGYSLKVVDRPDLLTFHRRPDGSYAASAVLPPIMSDPGKQLIVLPPTSPDLR